MRLGEVRGHARLRKRAGDDGTALQDCGGEVAQVETARPRHPLPMSAAKAWSHTLSV